MGELHAALREVFDLFSLGAKERLPKGQPFLKVIHGDADMVDLFDLDAHRFSLGRLSVSRATISSAAV